MAASLPVARSRPAASRSRATQVIVVLSRPSDAAAVSAYLGGSRWHRHVAAGAAAAAAASSSPAMATAGGTAASVTPAIRVVASEAVRSTGHALRMLDATSAIRTDTILLIDTPVLVSSARLDCALAMHAARYKADSDAIITVLLTPQGSPSDGPLHEQLVVTVNPTTSRLHAYVSVGVGASAHTQLQGPWPGAADVRATVRHSLVTPADRRQRCV